MKHANIALFVPHRGCTHRCGFCDQNRITGMTTPLRAEDVKAVAQQAIRHLGPKAVDAELAFFGGSFTALPEEYMCELLEAAQPFVQDGLLAGIRISTRPDAVHSDGLKTLAQYGVTAVELGAQSMDDRVLALCGRGHTAAAVEQAAGLVQAQGFSLGLQMMTGLHGDSSTGVWETARRLAALRPDTMRIYPTVVLRGTPFARLMEQGLYDPPGLESSVALCAQLLLFFHRQDMAVIRMGLHASPEVQNAMVGGAWHPAFRDLCEAHIYRTLVMQALADCPPGPVTLRVARGCASKMAGQQRKNRKELEEIGWRCRIVEDARLTLYQVEVETEGSVRVVPEIP